VVRQRAAYSDHEIGFGKATPRDLGGKAPGDPDGEGIVVEKPARRQRGGKQGVALLGKGAAGASGVGFDRAEPGHDDHASRPCDHLGRASDIARMRRDG
jgi:hypothetical protein